MAFTPEPQWPENIQGLIAEAKREKIPQETIWTTAISYIEGKQWITTDRNGLSITRGDALRSEVTINQVLGYYKTACALLVSQWPGVAVMPGSSSTEDTVKAKASERALRYWWHAIDLDAKLSEANEHLVALGSVGFHLVYDGEDIDLDVIDPFNLFWEPRVAKPADAQWVAIRTHIPRAKLMEQYKEEAERLAEVSATSTGQTKGTQPHDRLEVYEIYWRDGRHAIVCHDIYLFKEDKFPVEGLFPVYFARFTRIPRKLWGIGLVEPLVELQWYYNECRSQVVRNAQMMANPKVLIPSTSGVAMQAFTDQVGEKVNYNLGAEPKYLVPPPLPGFVLDNIARLQAEMADVAGIHSVSRGKRAVGVNSGEAIRALAEQDQNSLLSAQMEIEAVVKQVCRGVLLMMKTYFTEGKMMRMMDDEGRTIHEQIVSTNIVDDPEVIIEAGTMFRDGILDRDARVLNLFQAGLLEKDEVLEELSFHKGMSSISRKMRDLSHAQEVLEKIKVPGAVVEIYDYDNIPVFVDVFAEFMKSEDYYALPLERRDYIRDVFVALITPPGEESQYQGAQTMGRIFPRVLEPKAPSQQVMANVLSTSSPTAQVQMAEGQAELGQKVGALEDAEAMLPDEAEAMLSPISGDLGA